MDAWSPTRLWNLSIGGVACLLFAIVGFDFLGPMPDGIDATLSLLGYACAFVLVVKFTLGALVGIRSSMWEMVLLVAAGGVLAYEFVYANESSLGLVAVACYAVALAGVLSSPKPRSIQAAPLSG